jgi:hypothetical protein
MLLKPSWANNYIFNDIFINIMSGFEEFTQSIGSPIEQFLRHTVHLVTISLSERFILLTYSNIFIGRADGE